MANTRASACPWGVKKKSWIGVAFSNANRLVSSPGGFLSGFGLCGMSEAQRRQLSLMWSGYGLPIPGIYDCVSDDLCGIEISPPYTLSALVWSPLVVRALRCRWAAKLSMHSHDHTVA